MSDLISANALLKKVCILQSLDGAEVVYKHNILIAPIIDAVEVVRAEWKVRWVRVGDSGAQDYDGVFCSNCSVENNRKTRHCPNCGTKMDAHKKDVTNER